MGTGGHFPGGRTWRWRDADHSNPSNAEGENVLEHTTSPQSGKGTVQLPRYLRRIHDHTAEPEANWRASIDRVPLSRDSFHKAHEGGRIFQFVFMFHSTRHLTGFKRNFVSPCKLKTVGCILKVSGDGGCLVLNYTPGLDHRVNHKISTFRKLNSASLMRKGGGQKAYWLGSEHCMAPRSRWTFQIEFRDKFLESPVSEKSTGSGLLNSVRDTGLIPGFHQTCGNESIQASAERGGNFQHLIQH